ncbi:MAG TPA: hypothetical protein DCY26_16375 [Hyphomonas sp.]|nr:hypothetical protein [Hyphomonas sp.]
MNISSQATITLLLPFQRYRLRFSHRLLDSLGGVSRFVLRALADGLALEQIAEVTALSHMVLLQQMTFLERHHFVSIARDTDAPVVTLLERGARIIAVEQYLRQGDHRVWLDSFTVDRNAAHLLVTPDPGSLIRIPLGDSRRDARPEVRLPVRRYQYHLFDDVSRLHRLLDQNKLADLIGHFWSGAQELISEEVDYMDCVLAQETMDTQDYYPLRLSAGELLDIADTAAAGKKAALPLLLVPVLEVTLKFGRAEGFPWPVAIPPARTSYLELVTQRPLPHFISDGQADPAAPDVAVVPAAIGTHQPELTDTIVPAGLSVTCTTSRTYARRTIDHQALTRLMHKGADVFLISFNQTARETELAPEAELPCE